MHFQDEISHLLTVHNASAGQDVQDLAVKLNSAIRQMQTAWQLRGMVCMS